MTNLILVTNARGNSVEILPALSLLNHQVKIMPANRGGKIKALFQGFGVGFYVLPLSENMFWFRDSFMAVAIILTLATGVNYVYSAFKPGK